LSRVSWCAWPADRRERVHTVARRQLQTVTGLDEGDGRYISGHVHVERTRR
jgi:hypothetical protein